MRPVYPEWSDVLALLDRLEAAEALLREVRESPTRAMALESGEGETSWNRRARAFLEGEERQ